MSKRRFFDEMIKILAKKYPGKTRKELIEIRQKILKKSKVGDLIKKQLDQAKEKKEDPFSPENMERTMRIINRTMKLMESNGEYEKRKIRELRRILRDQKDRLKFSGIDVSKEEFKKRTIAVQNAIKKLREKLKKRGLESEQ